MGEDSEKRLYVGEGEAPSIITDTKSGVPRKDKDRGTEEARRAEQAADQASDAAKKAQQEAREKREGKPSGKARHSPAGG